MKPSTTTASDAGTPPIYNAPAPGNAAPGSDSDPASEPANDPTDQVTDLFRHLAPRVYGFVRLRADADTADEVVADTFVTAWRLHEQIPADPLPWLLTIARNALANRNRSTRRATRLAASMTTIAGLARHTPAAGETAVERQALLAAVAALRLAEREALVLTAWDGLTISGAAAVAGCTERTIARRLARARKQLGQAVTR